MQKCDSIELNPVIRQQIQQNALRETEKTFPPTGQQLLNQYTLSPPKTRTQHNTFTEEYEHRIWILETQKTEQSKDKFTLELRNIKDENYILKKLNHVLRKRNDSYESEIKRLNKVLLQATTTGKINSISTTVNPSLEAMTSEDFKTKNEVLMQQVKIYEEDFKRERAEKEIIRKEKEELQQIVHKLRIQLQIKGRP
ncbi:TNFAIP3-interacting protein 3-like [Hyla sarda]|uniref:TNFAIP3-interacting protein 3-like n=1 Tax=Hyla sarda TaxID=327740 RepID=UPI0024C2B400|nr:TNFAIP3-interacting protein 3-like [Hyla sarda]